MNNYKSSGQTVTLAAPADVDAGAGVLAGAIFGIAQNDALTGEPLVLVRTGVVTHAKTSAQAWTEGQKIYWDASNKVFSSTASGNTLVGAAVAVAANPSATGLVLLDGAVR